MAWPGGLVRGEFCRDTALGGFFGSRPRREEELGTELELRGEPGCELLRLPVCPAARLPVAVPLSFPRLPQHGNAANEQC